MALFLRRNEFEGEDYTVVHRDPDGSEHDIGHIFLRHAGQKRRRGSGLWSFTNARGALHRIRASLPIGRAQ